MTLTATVTGGAMIPAGRVTFESGGSVIDCATQTSTQTVGADGSSSFVETCTAAFAAANPPGPLVALFTPRDPAQEQASSSSPAALGVGRGSTTTALGASSVAGSLIYAADVAPGTSGPAAPSGTVTFIAGGRVIGSCASVPLSAGRATCTVSPGAPGPSPVTAVYSGDANFLRSSSDPPGSAAGPVTTASPSPAPMAAATRPSGTGASAPRPPAGVAAVGHARATGRVAAIAVGCGGTRGGTCSVTLTLSVREPSPAAPGTRRTVGVGAKRVTLASPQRETVHVRVNAAGRRLLARRRRLAVTLTASTRPSVTSCAR